MPGSSPGVTNESASTSGAVSQREIEQAKLHALLALPAVESEAARHVDAAPAVLQQRMAKLLPRGAEGDAVDDRAIAGAQPHTHMCLPDLLGIGDAVSGQRNHRLGIAGAERPCPRQARNQLAAGGRGG